MKALLIFLLGLAVIRANDDFQKINYLSAINTYKQMSQNETYLVSSFSFVVIMAFVQSGCKGQTGVEIRQALHMPPSEKEIESQVKAALLKMKGNQFYSLQTVNKIYVQKNFQINKSFQTIATDAYLANFENIDFSKSADAAKSITKWVENQTNNKIQNLISPKELDSNTRTILINTIYFKANWSKPFDPLETRRRPFYINSKDTIEVNMMHHYSQVFDYYECSELNSKIIKLPFVGGDAEMVIYLPNEKEGLPKLKQQIEKVFIPHNFTKEIVNVAIPDFNIVEVIDLKDTLMKFGVRKIFDIKQADLSGIAGKKGDLVINEILQNSFIYVNEQGAESASGSKAQVNNGSSYYYYRTDPVVSKEFIADHPFSFSIVIKQLVVFNGAWTGPTGSANDIGNP